MGDVSTQRMNVARGRVEEQASAVEEQEEESRARAEGIQKGAEALAERVRAQPVQGREEARRQRFRLSSLKPSDYEAREAAVNEAAAPTIAEAAPPAPASEDLGGTPAEGMDVSRNYDWFQQREGGAAQAYRPEKRRYRFVGATTGQGKPNDGDPYTPGEVQV